MQDAKGERRVKHLHLPEILKVQVNFVTPTRGQNLSSGHSLLPISALKSAWSF